MIDVELMQCYIQMTRSIRSWYEFCSFVYVSSGVKDNNNIKDRGLEINVFHNISWSSDFSLQCRLGNTAKLLELVF